MAQQAVIGHFSGRVSDEDVVLSWIVNQGSTCTGLCIERSSDGETFEEIYCMPGVCGSLDEPARYDFTDIAPIPNQANFYRLDVADRPISDIIRVDVILFGENGYAIWPNPFDVSSTLYFHNPNGGKTYLEIFAPSGLLVATTWGDRDRYPLDGLARDEGLYFFRIKNADGAVLTAGRFMVSH